MLYCRLNTNVAIYEALSRAYKHGDVEPWDDVDRYVAKMFLADFEQSGIHLPEHQVRKVKSSPLHLDQKLCCVSFQRKEFVNLNNSILLEGNSFEIGCSSPASVKVNKLPDDLRVL